MQETIENQSMKIHKLEKEIKMAKMLITQDLSKSPIGDSTNNFNFNVDMSESDDHDTETLQCAMKQALDF